MEQCTATMGKIKGVLFVKKVSNYMRKKYGYAKALELNFKQAVKKGQYVKY